MTTDKVLDHKLMQQYLAKTSIVIIQCIQYTYAISNVYTFCRFVHAWFWTVKPKWIIRKTIQKIIRANFCILFSQKKPPLMKSHLRFFLCCFGVCLFPLSTGQAYYLFYFFFISLILQISELEFFAWTIKISKNQFNQPTTKMKWRKKTNKKFKTFEIQKQIKLVK